MTHSSEAVACIASTPAAAKVFVARLQAEGIPARVEGDSLADEFAASRRLLNLMGTRVLVPRQALAAARAILQPVAIEPSELERQALAAAPGAGVGEPPPVAAGPNWSWKLLMLLPLLAVAAFALVG
jgi:hypothetical protein